MNLGSAKLPKTKRECQVFRSLFLFLVGFNIKPQPGFVTNWAKAIDINRLSLDLSYAADAAARLRAGRVENPLAETQ
jgi:hypothetical protein